jgi:hypothetical protein
VKRVSLFVQNIPLAYNPTKRKDEEEEEEEEEEKIYIFSLREHNT